MKYYVHYRFTEIRQRGRECTMIVFNSEANLLIIDFTGSAIYNPIVLSEGDCRIDKD